MGEPRCPTCASLIDSGTCPRCASAPSMGRQAEALKCPMCAELIKPAARKCPFCREVLDPSLRREREVALQQDLAREIDRAKLRERIAGNVGATLVAMVLFNLLGVAIAPIVFGLALYYRARVRALGMQRPSELTALFIVAAAWFTIAAGIIVWVTIG
jgi:hypothetical protein